MSANRRWAALLGLLVSLVMVTGLVPVASARADGQVSISLTSISPNVLTNSGELVISGTLTNLSDESLDGVEVALWRDATPLRTLDAVDRALASDRPGGAVMESASARISLNSGAPIPAGGTADFTVRSGLGPDAAEQLWLSEPDAAYQVGVQAFGRLGSGPHQQLGHAGTLIAYPGSEPVRAATIVVLNRPPSLLPLAIGDDGPAVFRDEGLAADLAGRLDGLLSVAEQPGALAVVDPALFDEVTALAAGYRVQRADGSLTSGSTAAAGLAGSWLARLEGLAAQDRLARGVYGSVDVVAAGEGVLNRAAEALPRNHRLARLPLVVVPAGLDVDQATLDTLRSLGPWLVLAENLAGGSLLQQQDSLVLLAAERPGASGSALEQASLLRARQLVADRQGRPLVSVVNDTAAAELLADQARWISPQTVASLTADRPQAPLWLGEITGHETAPELIAASERASGLLDAWGELVDSEQDYSGIIASAWSTTFDRQADAQIGWLAASTGPAAQGLGSDAIHLRITDWVTTSADDNLLPVTIVNQTQHAVRLHVQFTSENPLRISVEPSELVTIEAGESATVRVRPRTEGNGKVAITAQLATESGHLIGPPAAFVITGTEAGRVAWLIIVASGAVLLVATALRVRQVRQSRRPDAA